MPVHETDICDLYVDSVTKSFGQNRVLTDIFLSCRPGEIIGLLGRNGSGKSTLMKIIFGSIYADTKFVRVCGKMVNSPFDSKGLVKYLPQNNFLPENVGVRTILRIYCDDLQGTKIAADDDIGPILERKVGTLSGGERRLLEVYLTLYAEAKFLLIDEPFDKIAPIYREKIKNLIREQSKGKGVVVTDQNYHEILDLATRVVLLTDGGLKNINDPDELAYWGYTPG